MKSSAMDDQLSHLHNPSQDMLSKHGTTETTPRIDRRIKNPPRIGPKNGKTAPPRVLDKNGNSSQDMLPKHGTTETPPRIHRRIENPPRIAPKNGKTLCPRIVDQNGNSSPSLSSTDSEDESIDHLVAGYFSQAYVGLGKVDRFIDEVDDDVAWVLHMPGDPDPGHIFSTIFPHADPMGAIVWMLVTKSVADVYQHLVDDAERFDAPSKSCTSILSEFKVSKLSPNFVSTLMDHVNQQ